MRLFLKFLLLVFMGTFLVACGFHLRQASNIPPNFKTIYLTSDTPFGTFETTMKNNLRSFGFNVVKDEKNAALIFAIADSAFASNDSTLPSMQTRIYTFTFSTNYTLKTKDGKVVISSKAVSASRSATLNINEILGSSNQVTTIKEELMRNVIGQILNQVNANMVSEALTLMQSNSQPPISSMNNEK